MQLNLIHYDYALDFVKLIFNEVSTNEIHKKRGSQWKMMTKRVKGICIRFGGIS